MEDYNPDMITKAQTAEFVAFSIGFVVLFSAFRWIMFSSIVATGWLCAAVFELFPGVSMGFLQKMHSFLALVSVFGLITVVVQSIKFAVCRCFDACRPTTD